MIKVFGIKNCDTMKKAFTWLEANKIAYEFHDYKKSGISEAQILEWLKQQPLEVLINTKGQTWKKLPEEERNLITNKEKAIQLMIRQPSMIKRPLVALPKQLLLGFEPEQWKAKLK